LSECLLDAIDELVTSGEIELVDGAYQKTKTTTKENKTIVSHNRLHRLVKEIEFHISILNHT
jgi:hypothetical protein